MFRFEFIFRIIISTLCGGAIGFERKSRLKEAGIRTHVILSIGSCLIMILSKYGFGDVNTGDPARLAAQVVSGVGFLGAGMILIRKNVVSGLTTAAGIWTTAAIGLAIGAGMWMIAVFCTILVIVVEYIFRTSVLGKWMAHQEHMTVVVRSKDDIQSVMQKIESMSITICEWYFRKNERDEYEIQYFLQLPRKMQMSYFIVELAKETYVTGVEL